MADIQNVKLRVLKSVVVAGGDADALTGAINEFYASYSETEAEVVSIIYVADFTVLITFTGG